MKKQINLINFIIFQTNIMLLIGIIYLFIVPKIKPMCNSNVKCANATNCSCKDKTCSCEIINSNGDTEKIECYASYEEIKQSLKYPFNKFIFNKIYAILYIR